MEFALNNLCHFAQWLISYTDSIEIIGPEELKESYRGLVKKIPQY